MEILGRREVNEIITVIGVRFKKAGKVYYFDPGALELGKGDYVIVETTRGLEYGADDYMTKPFSPGELVARIKSHIRRYERLKGNQDPSEVITHRGLEINTASRAVYVNGRETQMTAREYELLLFLASNPGIVFSKEHILNSIWGDDYYGDAATVAVHIQKIRKKIERDPSSPEFIETLWGTGYRFNK